MRRFSHLAAFIPLPALIAPAHAAEHWHTDLPAALQQAAALQGYVLVDFTGSDWCGACIELQKDVLHTPAFTQYARENKLVLVEIDLPHAPRIPAKLKASNQALAKHYRIHGYPTILLLTPEGYVAGGFIGYKAGNDVIAVLDECLAAAQGMTSTLQAASQHSGIAQAKLLYKAYTGVDRQFRSSNHELFQRIVKLTPKDETGILAEQARQDRARQQIRDIQSKSSVVGSDHAARQTILLDLLARGDWEPEAAARLYTMRADYLYYHATSIDDIKLAYGLYLRALQELPELEAEMKPEYDRFFAEPEKLFTSKSRPMPPRHKPFY